MKASFTRSLVASFDLLLGVVHVTPAQALEREVILESGTLDASFGARVDLGLRLTNWFEGKVYWSQIANKLPPGFSLQASSTDEARVSGVVQFDGQWCFSLVAKVSSQPSGLGTFCIQSADNPSLKYPKLAGDSRFIVLNRWKYDISYMPVDSSSITGASGQKKLSVQIIDGGLPSGIHMTVDLPHDRLVFSGTALDSNPNSVTLKLINGDGESSYVVLSNIVTIDTTCEEGYTYDYVLNMCVVDENRSCPTGYVYNSATRRCEVYQLQCPRGYYFDVISETCKLLERRPRLH